MDPRLYYIRGWRDEPDDTPGSATTRVTRTFDFEQQPRRDVLRQRSFPHETPRDAMMDLAPRAFSRGAEREYLRDVPDYEAREHGGRPRTASGANRPDRRRDGGPGGADSASRRNDRSGSSGGNNTSSSDSSGSSSSGGHGSSSGRVVNTTSSSPRRETGTNRPGGDVTREPQTDTLRSPPQPTQQQPQQQQQQQQQQQTRSREGGSPAHATPETPPGARSPSVASATEGDAIAQARATAQAVGRVRDETSRLWAWNSSV